MRIDLLRPNRNIDPSSLQQNMELLQDCYLNDMGAFVKRPGYSEFVDLGETAKVDGIYWWDAKRLIISVCNGKVFKTSTETGTTAEITSATMEVGTLVTFAEVLNGSTLLLFMANGGKITYTDGTTTTAMADVDAPTTVTHIVHLDTFLIANKVNSSTWYYSNPNAPLVWDSGDSYDAEMAPDDIQAIHEFGRRLYIFGRTTIEPWYNQGVSGDPFARLGSASLIPFGAYSADSIVRSDDALYFIDDTRRIVRIAGDDVKVVSQPYNKFLQELDSVQLSYMYKMSILGHDLVFTNLFSDDKTLVYDLTMQAWYQWGTWESSDYTLYKARVTTYSRRWKSNYFGSAINNGKIYKVDTTIFNDDSTAIRAFARTGHINWGDEGLVKSSSGLVARLKRGRGIDSSLYSEPSIKVRKRDNGREWSNWVTIGLGAVGDRELQRHIYRGRGGKYFTRQYEILMPDNAPCVVTGLWENINGTRPG